MVTVKSDKVFLLVVCTEVNLIRCIILPPLDANDEHPFRFTVPASMSGPKGKTHCNGSLFQYNALGYYPKFVTIG